MDRDGGHSGRRSPRGAPAKKQRTWPGCPRRSEQDGFGSVEVCPHHIYRRHRASQQDGACRWMSVSRSLCLRAQQQGVREIARQLGRSPSTISRELGRNAATRSGGFAYPAITAQWHADRAARRPKRAKLAADAALRRYVQERLAGKIATPAGKALAGPAVAWKGRRHGPRQHRRWSRAWSPEQIAHRLLAHGASAARASRENARSWQVLRDTGDSNQ